MRHGFIKVAALTPKIRVADPAYNAERICEKLREAWERRAKIIVFPELCITGYSCEDLFLQELLLREALGALKQIAGCTKGQDALVFVGLPVEVGQKLYNAAAVLRDGEVLGLIPKTYIPNYGEFYEGRHFAPGGAEVADYLWDGKRIPFGSRLLFACEEIPALVVGCEICEDMWAAETPGTSHALAGATVLVNLSASNETVAKDEYRKMLLESGSARLVCGYVYASAGEGESTQDVVFSGHNMIAENGTILAEAARFSGEGAYGELDVYRICEERRRINTFRTRRDGYTILPFSLKEEETRLTRKFDSAPFVPTEEFARKKRCDDILKLQCYGLKKRMEHTGAKGAVVGVSGGLDSTLALLVTARCFDLLGRDRKGILAVTMPCFGTTDRTYQNACKLAKTLGAVLREVDIKDAVLQHFRDIGQDVDNHDVTYENGQARERTQVLMDIANQEGGLVVGTGDMSELALGWATYNGDHMSMYGVNAGVPKTLVRHLVRYFAQTEEDEVLQAVLTDVLDTPVSPELLPPVGGKIAQKTEDLVGLYELHDFFLYYVLRLGFSPSKVYRIARETFGGAYAYEEIAKWLKTFYRRFFSQQFKRSCLPDGPKVGSVALSPRGDLRMPSDASAAAWMREIEKIRP